MFPTRVKLIYAFNRALWEHCMIGKYRYLVYALASVSGYQLSNVPYPVFLSVSQRPIAPHYPRKKAGFCVTSR